MKYLTYYEINNMTNIVFFTFHIKFDKWIVKSNIY